MPSSSQRAPLVVAAVLIAGIALRWIHLGDDPRYAPWMFFITDEGRWTSHARSLVLFGDLSGATWMLHLLLAPLFQAAVAASFFVGGVTLTSARAVTALAGSAMLLLFWFGLRRRLAAGALLAGLAIVAFDPDLIALSRVAIPEVAALLVTFGAFLTLTTATRPLHIVGAGMLMAMAIGTKATIAGTILPFTALVLVVHAGRRVRAVLELWAGLLLIGATLLVTAAVGGWLPDLVNPSTMHSITRRLPLLEPRDLVLRIFEYPRAPSLPYMLFAAWAGSLAWSTRADRTDRRLVPLYLGSLFWLVWAMAQMLIIEYHPPRYAVHAVVPAAVHVATGLSVFRPSRLRTGSLLWRVTAALPLPVLLAPLMIHVVALAAGDVTRVRYRLIALALASVVTMLLVWSASATRMRGLVTSAAIAGTAALVLLPMAHLPGFWIGGDARVHLAGWGLLLGTAALAGWWASTHWPEDGRWRPVAVGATAAATVTMTLLMLPALTSPRDTMREASARIAHHLADVPVVDSVGAETLIVPTRLQYRVIFGRDWPDDWSPDALVISGRFDDTGGRLAREFELLDEMTLSAGPPGSRPVKEIYSSRQQIRIYRRRP